ncbi:hypothetical protein HpMS107_41920 [Helicobacter pylori]
MSPPEAPAGEVAGMEIRNEWQCLAGIKKPGECFDQKRDRASHKKTGMETDNEAVREKSLGGIETPCHCNDAGTGMRGRRTGG